MFCWRRRTFHTTSCSTWTKLGVIFPQTDVALVIGANDVTNPAARTDPGSSITGCRFSTSTRSRTVMVIKRGMSPEFGGIDNPLYYLDQALWLFGRRRKSSSEILSVN